MILPGWAKAGHGGKGRHWHRWTVASDGLVASLCGFGRTVPSVGAERFPMAVKARLQCAFCRTRALELQHQAELPVA